MRLNTKSRYAVMALADMASFKENMPISLHQNNAWTLKEVNNLGGNELMVNYIRNRKVDINR